MRFPLTQQSDAFGTLQLPTWALEAIEAQALEDVGFIKKIPGDLADAGASSGSSIFDATVPPPAIGVVEEQTITFPIGDPVNTVPATFVGTGFLTNIGLPNMALNTLMEIELEFTFDAGTGPTYTPEAATLSDVVSEQTIDGYAIRLHAREGLHLATRRIVSVPQYLITVNARPVGFYSFSGLINYFEQPDPVMGERIVAAITAATSNANVSGGFAPVVPDSVLNPIDDGATDGDLS